jgi:hypothetical protein
MLVRMLVELSGPGMLLVPGDERDFPQAEALRLVAAEYAVPVAEQRVERAVLEQPVETRHGKRVRPRKEI